MGVEDKRVILTRAPERLLFGTRLPNLPKDGLWDGDESSGFLRAEIATDLAELLDVEGLTLEQLDKRVLRRSQVYPGNQINDNS